MRFFLDTTETDEARKVKDWGVLDGIIVRPAAAEAAGRDFRKLLGEMAQITDGPVVAPVSTADAKGMYKEGRELHKFGKNVIIRIPFTADGLKVVRLLGDEQISSDVTLVYTPVQALLSARAGAAYVSPGVSELDDMGQIGIDVVEQIIRVYDTYGLQAQLMVDMATSPLHVLDAATIGADVAILSFDVLEKLFDHPLTQNGVGLLKLASSEGPRRLN